MIDTAGWTDELLFSTVLGHQFKGIMLHNDLANLSGFCGLHKLQKWHMCRVQEETENHLKTQAYYILHHQKMPITEKGIVTSLIPNQAYSTKTNEVKNDYRRKFVKDMMEKWKAWEDETIGLYLAANDYLYRNQNKDVMFFKKMLKETYKEYEDIVKCKQKLEILDYDIDEIMEIEKY